MRGRADVGLLFEATGANLFFDQRIVLGWMEKIHFQGRSGQLTLEKSEHKLVEATDEGCALEEQLERGLRVECWRLDLVRDLRVMPMFLVQNREQVAADVEELEGLALAQQVHDGGTSPHETIAELA